MARILKSSFLWQFTGGFMLGAVGLFAMQPAEAAVPTPPAAIHAAL